MGTTLQHGIFLPAKGERNCYAGLASNWTILDGVVGGYSSHAANFTIHVTAADKEAWNGKADASALTAHTGDTTIHVTAADKQTWDTVTNKANDTDVLHLTGDESAAGDKNFQGLLTTIPSASLWPNVSNTTDDITFLGRSVIHIEYKSSGQLSNLSGGAWSVAELGAGCFFFSINSGTDIRFKNVATGDVNRIPVVAGTNRFINDVSPNQNNTYDLGSASYRWRTLNGINPGTLSLPNLSAGVDISGYITAGITHNEYTPTVDGWISVILKKTTTSGTLAIFLYQGDVGNSYFGNTALPNETEFCGMASIPVKAGSVVNIDLKGSNTYVYSAKFYPCMGNV